MWGEEEEEAGGEREREIAIGRESLSSYGDILRCVRERDEKKKRKREEKGKREEEK